MSADFKNDQHLRDWMRSQKPFPQKTPTHFRLIQMPVIRFKVMTLEEYLRMK